VLVPKSTVSNYSAMIGEHAPLMHKMDDESHLDETTANNGSGVNKLIGMVLVLFCLLLYASDSFFVVPPGTIGVVVTLGHVQAFDSGFHRKTPFVSEVIEFTAKTQKLEEENDIPTKEGLNVRLDTAV
jgi:regulator of protease activity HflC (stomatin/prohibitin superfamily)